MLIGERVRLRVCSQCCRTPNCNVGSGAHEVRPSLMLLAFWLGLAAHLHLHLHLKLHLPLPAALRRRLVTGWRA